MATDAKMGFSCGNGSSWPNVYHACNNANGLHLVGGNSAWGWAEGNVTLNVDMEVYVR